VPFRFTFVARLPRAYAVGYGLPPIVMLLCTGSAVPPGLSHSLARSHR